MLKALASGWLYKAWTITIFGFLVALPWATLSHANGKGPVGVWPASARFSLVADTSLPGLVLVDVTTGAAIERMVTADIRPVGIASCPTCDFALLSGGKADYWLLHFSAPVAQLLQHKGTLDLDNARLERLDIITGEGKLTDGRMCLVSDDGKTAFVAAMEDHVVARVDFAKTPNAVTLLKDRKMQPFGLNWDRDGGLLVAMHKQEVWRMTVNGEVVAKYDTKAAGCPGTAALQPNLRAAIDDPVNAGSLLILASNPRSYDAVVWRLSVDAQGKQSCSSVAGKIGVDPGWVDASGEAIEFSRPHYFALRPDTHPPQLIITDIDNRALRLLDLTTYASATVMYNRDRIVAALPLQAQSSAASCAELNWPTAFTPTGPGGHQFCVSPVQAEGLALTLEQASGHCSAQGARLCEPHELLTAGVAEGVKAWTRAECASCWQRKADKQCTYSSDDHKTLGISHAHNDFAQSWNSGQALVVGAARGGAPATALCRPVVDGFTASAPCCADAVSAKGEAGE